MVELDGATWTSQPLDEDARQAGYDLVIRQGIATWGDEAIAQHAQYLQSRGITVPTRAVQYAFIQGMRDGQAELAQRSTHLEHPMYRERLWRSKKAKAAAQRAEALIREFEVAVEQRLTAFEAEGDAGTDYGTRYDALVEQLDAMGKHYEAIVQGSLSRAGDEECEYLWRGADRAWDAQTRFSQVRFKKTVSDEEYIQQVANDPVTHTIEIQGIPVEVPAVVDVVAETYGNSIEGTIDYLNKHSKRARDGEAVGGADILRAMPISEISTDDRLTVNRTVWKASDPADTWADGMDAEVDLFAELDKALNTGRKRDRYFRIAAVLEQTTGVAELDEQLYAYAREHAPEFFEQQDEAEAGKRRRGNRTPKEKKPAGKANRRDWGDDDDWDWRESA